MYTLESSKFSAICFSLHTHIHINTRTHAHLPPRLAATHAVKTSPPHFLWAYCPGNFNSGSIMLPIHHQPQLQSTAALSSDPAVYQISVGLHQRCAYCSRLEFEPGIENGEDGQNGGSEAAGSNEARAGGVHVQFVQWNEKVTQVLQ